MRPLAMRFKLTESPLCSVPLCRNRLVWDATWNTCCSPLAFTCRPHLPRVPSEKGAGSTEATWVQPSLYWNPRGPKPVNRGRGGRAWGHTAGARRRQRTEAAGQVELKLLLNQPPACLRGPTCHLFREKPPRAGSGNWGRRLTLLLVCRRASPTHFSPAASALF